ncbi:hypothetical protein Ahy_B10g102899 [Arachis hypogaea]|uniref:HAT C-terminal dimerisation domain-containing protein n=1 Tax=Arachis hypogaea TaxID=3818 RepID=A0A444X2Q3_ARAHY|nr:hypothetical protein Ahy_B10g102899 [Arachis hypogaea]
MARDLLSIPITIVALEYAFSIGSHVLNKYRSRLLPDNIKAVVCTRNSICEFAHYEKDSNEEDIAKDEGYSSGVCSNDDGVGKPIYHPNHCIASSVYVEAVVLVPLWLAFFASASASACHVSSVSSALFLGLSDSTSYFSSLVQAELGCRDLPRALAVYIFQYANLE